jgi:hypothetical protein
MCKEAAVAEFGYYPCICLEKGVIKTNRWTKVKQDKALPLIPACSVTLFGDYCLSHRWGEVFRQGTIIVNTSMRQEMMFVLEGQK